MIDAVELSQRPPVAEKTAGRAEVLATDISNYRSIPANTFRQATILRQHQPFRYVAFQSVPGGQAGRMFPEQKVIPKMDFDLPIATCRPRLKSWQGSSTLSSRNACGHITTERDNMGDIILLTILRVVREF